MTTQLTSGKFTLDGAGSTVEFRNKTFWGLATVHGVFGSVSGTGEVAADGSGHGTLTVGAASLNTKNAKRDEHLRSKDFFEADGFPEITFEAAHIVPNTEGGAQVDGSLTVRGTSRELSFPARVETQGTDAVVLSATVDVARADFGLNWNRVGMVGPTASIAIKLRFTAAS